METASDDCVIYHQTKTPISFWYRETELQISYSTIKTLPIKLQTCVCSSSPSFSSCSSCSSSSFFFFLNIIWAWEIGFPLVHVVHLARPFFFLVKHCELVWTHVVQTHSMPTSLLRICPFLIPKGLHLLCLGHEVLSPFLVRPQKSLF